MSDALLKNTFNKISPAYELVADIEIATATTQVDFSGLNFGKDDDLLLVSTVVNGNGSGNIVSLFVNGNYTNTNYYVQWLSGNGSTAPSGTRMNNSYFGVSSSSDTSMIETKIKLTNSGYLVAQTKCARDFIGSDIQILDTMVSSTFTISSITSLRILGSVSNLIGIGSRFQLYRLKAKKVADIIVSSATTQVDITGLSIDKDSEYMLVSDVVNTSASNSAYSLFPNDNVTQTNYYQQNLKVDSTTVSGSRVNNNRIAEAIASRKSFSNTNIKITNNSYFVTQSNETRDYGLSTILLNKFYDTSTFTLTSITKLSIVSSIANAIGIGSRFTLYKMK